MDFKEVQLEGALIILLDYTLDMFTNPDLLSFYLAHIAHPTWASQHIYNAGGRAINEIVDFEVFAPIRIGEDICFIYISADIAFTTWVHTL